ncbi:MAG: glycoside hydrolase family 16 protein [Bacilli bacterium]
MKKILKVCSLPLLFAISLSFKTNNQTNEIEQRKFANRELEVLEGEELDYENEFYDDFSSGIDSSSWGVVERVWGTNESYQNGGTRHENVFVGANGLSLRALGDYYTGNEFVNTNEGASSTDGKRTGGVIASKQTFGPGRFEIKTRIPSIPGAAYAFWGYLNETIDDVKYYNEMDFEFPLYQYLGETQVYAFDRVYLSTYTDDSDESFKTTKYPTLSSSIADGEYHTLTFDWIYSETHKQVSFYIDNVYIATNTVNVSPYDMHIWIGTWVSANPYNFGSPKFDKAYMDVKYFSYVPFKNQVNEKVESTLTSYTDEYMTETDEVYVSRNMLPNSSFDLPSLTGYSYNASKTEILSDYDYEGDASSYGVRLYNPSGGAATLTYSIFAKGLQPSTFSFMYKGAGSLTVTLYDYDGSALVANSDISISSGTLNKSTYTEASYTISPTINTCRLTLSFYTESSSGFYIDNLYLGTSITKDERPTSYSFSLEDGSSTTIAYTNDLSLSFTNDENQTWKSPYARYYVTGAGYKSYCLANYDGILNNTEELSDEYNAIKECIINDSLYTGTTTYHYINLGFMTFDVDYFEDISLSFNAITGTGYQKASIIYSIDKGESWHVLTTQRNNEFVDNGEGYYRYNITADKSKLSSSDSFYQTIRFGFVGTTWTNSTYFNLDAVVINNKNDFKNRLDGKYGNDICSASIGARNLIQREYSLLSEDDLVELGSTLMESDPTKNYLSGYEYHLSRWNAQASALMSRLYFDGYSSNLLFVSSIIIVCGLSIALLLIVKKKHIKNR